MPESPSSALREVVGSLAPILEGVGFQRQGACFNRSTEPGLVQAIEVLTGRRPPPGMGWGDYGTVTIGLGVFVLEVEQALRVDPQLERPPDPVHEWQCHVKANIGHLMPGQQEQWWEMLRSTTAAGEAHNALVAFGLPWLDQMTTRQGVINVHTERNEAVVWLGLNALEFAVIHFRLGESTTAQELIREYLASDLRSIHRSFVVEKVLPMLGMYDLLSEEEQRPKSVRFRTDEYAEVGAPQGSAGVVEEVRPEGYMVQLIGPEGWGPVIGPVPPSEVSEISGTN